jgi:endogenous inhibitor of DNA gyrase (YacG/DUF329 family)
VKDAVVLFHPREFVGVVIWCPDCQRTVRASGWITRGAAITVKCPGCQRTLR